MILSMTGFGEASATVDHVHYTVELRSLNNRYLKVSCRLPEMISGLEGELEQRMKKHLRRGSVTITVKARVEAEGAVDKVNDQALAEYLSHLKMLRQQLGGEGTTVDLANLLQLPGVLQPAEDESQRQAKAKTVLIDLLDEAAGKLNKMRHIEGQALAGELAVHCDAIRAQAAIVREQAPKVAEQYHERLQARVQEMLHKAELEVGKVDLLREVAVYADRIDITEELARTEAHLDQFAAVVKQDDGEPGGRTLDFIAQELLREANTIASKSNDASIARAAVEMKSSIDRIKEQVQNVE